MENKDLLIQKLEKFIRKYYHNIAIRGCIVFLAISALLFLIISLFEYFSYSNPLLRAFLFYGFIIINIGILLFFILRPLLKKVGLLKRLSYEEAARIIGRHFPEIDDKLLNTIQLNRQLQDEIHIKSMDLLLASIDFKITQIKPFTFHKAINFKENLTYAKYAIVPLLLILLIGIWNKAVFTEPAHRLVHYNQVFEKPAPYRFIIENKQLTAFENEDFMVEISIEGDEVPAEAFIEINNHSYRLEQISTTRFQYKLKNLQSSLRFHLHTDEVSSPDYSLKVLPKPMMINFSISLEYPSYLNKVNEVVDNNGDLSVPQGTKISWKFNTRNTDEVILHLNNRKYILHKQKDIFTYSLRAMESIGYTVFNKNQYLLNQDSLFYHIHVIPDLYPQISVISMRDSVFMDRFYFKGNISDDYGFKKLNFVYAILDDKDSLSTKKIIDIPIDASLNGQDFYYYFDAQSLKLALGQKLEYYFEVWDNDAINGSKLSRSLRMEFRLPTEKEIQKQSEEISSQSKSTLQQLMKESENILKSIDDLKKKLVHKEQVSWEEKKQMESLLKQLQDIKKDIEKISEQQFQQQQLENKLNPLEEELLRKQEELQKRFNELFTDEMKQMMNEIEMLMQHNLDKNKFNEIIEKIELSTEELNKQLDQDLALFKQLEFEKKMETTLQKARELAEQQQKLAEETLEKESTSEQQLEKQQDIKNEFNQLMDDVKSLEQLNQRLDDPYKLPDTKTLEQEIKNDIKEAENHLQKNNKSKSAESQKKAGKKMQEMSDQMQSSFEQEQSQNLQEDMQTIRQILENIIKVSFQQENLMNRLSKTSTQDPALKNIIQEQYKMKDNLQMIEDSITAVAKRQPQVAPYVSKQINTINNAQKQIIDAIQLTQDRIMQYYRPNNNFNYAVSKQHFVMTSLNDLALMLAESLNNLKKQEQSGSSGKSSSCSKSKPKKGDPGKQNMKSMREMQEKLNRQLKELREQMQNPGKQDKGQTMSEQFARMAAQQEAIRRMMQDYLSELKKEGKGYDGQLERLMQEMEKTEKELVHKMINQQTMKRQEQIMTRLLESERAELEREKEEKRESKQGQDKQLLPPPELINEKLKQKNELELYKTIPPSLNYFYKNKVNHYFYHMK